MGFQITVMLTLVVYIEGLSQNLPIMQNINQAPRLLHFFIVSIVVIAVSILVTTVSLVISHAAAGFEMTEWQAWCGIKIADGLNRIPGVHLPPSALPPYLFKILDREPPHECTLL